MATKELHWQSENECLLIDIVKNNEYFMPHFLFSIIFCIFAENVKNMEEWRNIEKYEGSYQVSNEGRVKSIERKVPFRNSFRTIKERILKLIDDEDEYKVVNLYKEGSKKMKKVHRLVADAFIPNPDKLPQVNHKDENHSNNNVDNLEWCDPPYNLNYGSRNARASQTSFNGKKSKKVNQYTLEGEFVKEWPSMREAERNGFDATSISNCCLGKQQTHKGYKWSFLTN